MNCGFSRICINPPVGFPIAGGYRAKYSLGIGDDLFARATAFSNGEEKALIIAVDVCYMSDEMNDEARTRISASCGIDRDAIIITSSHTHQGPVVGPRMWEPEVSVEWYERELVDKICEVAEAAFSDLHPAKLFSATGEAKDVSYIRRYIMKDGSVVTNPGFYNPEIDHPIGEPDDRVGLLKIVREGANDVYIVNFGTHPCNVGGWHISADYPGVICSALEGAIGGVDCMFILSVAGDTSYCYKNYSPTKEEWINRQADVDSGGLTLCRAKRIGYAIAGEVLKICMLAKEIKADGISFAMRDVFLPANKDGESYEEAVKITELHKAGRASELPYKDMALTTVIANASRVIRMREYPDFLPYKMFALRIGDFFLAGLPGEPFTEIGRRIFDASPYPCTMISTITNAASLYIPTSEAFRQGGYETATSNIGMGSDDVLVNNMIELMKELNS